MIRHRISGKSGFFYRLTVSGLVVLFVFGGLFLHRHFMIHSVIGTSMERALYPGDYVVIKKRGAIRRYSVIAFSQKKEMYIKRVIGQPGDEILVQKQTLVIDLDKNENYANTLRVSVSPEIAKELQGQTRIPENCYFVLGDHLDVSKDSRSLGYIKKESVEGTLSMRW